MFLMYLFYCFFYRDKCDSSCSNDINFTIMAITNNEGDFLEPYKSIYIICNKIFAAFEDKIYERE